MFRYLFLILLFTVPCHAGESEAIAALKTSGASVDKLSKGGYYVYFRASDVPLKRFKLIDEIPDVRMLVIDFDVRDDGKLAHAKAIKTLTYFKTHGSSFRDADMKHIGEMAGLTRCDIDSNALTDKGLLELAKIKGLTRVVANSLNVTKAGRERLNELLPKCVVQ